MMEVETPAIPLPATVLAHQAIQPAVEPSGQVEICPVNGEDERIVEHGLVEPVGHNQFDAVRAPVPVAALLPFVDPGEAVPAPFRRLPDGGGDRRRLQTIQRRLQALIVPRTGPAADIGENLVWGGGHQPGGAQTRVTRLDDLARGPDQDVGIPDRGHTVIGNSLDPDADAASGKVDRRNTLRLGEGEEGIGHKVLRISGGEDTGQRTEQIELSALGAGFASIGHDGIAGASAHEAVGLREVGERMALRWQYLPARVGCGGHGAPSDPGLQVLDRIDHTPAKLVVGWTGAVGPVLFQRASGQAEELRGFLGAQIARGKFS